MNDARKDTAGPRRLLWMLLALLQAGAAHAQAPPDLRYAVAAPVPPLETRAENVGAFETALDQIREAIPPASSVGLFFEEGATDSTDWLAYLDAADARGFQAVIVFFTVMTDGSLQGFRPEQAGGAWQLGSLGGFAACRRCAGHPALYALATVDEPWHGQKRPFYTTADLQSMYAALKALAPVDFKILVGFSRQLWRRIVDETHPELYWDEGVADVVMISGLEFQDGAYQFDLLDQNHYWSRRIVHEKTPGVPLWTTAQVFGGRYGPGAGYWFPRERDGAHDLETLLDDLTARKYQAEHPLTGIMFQRWDSDSTERRERQFTLGDAFFPGQPDVQVLAATDAVQAIQRWLDAATGAEAPPERAAGADLALRAFPQPAADRLTVAFEVPEAGAYEVALYDLLGRRVQPPLRQALAPGPHQVVLGVQALPPGLYVVRVAGGRHTTSKAWVRAGR